MIPIFDLDDTLYAEKSYVESGFRTVAKELEKLFGWPNQTSFDYMLAILEYEGRGTVFNRLLEANGVMSYKLVRHCINTYRHHLPSISLLPEALCVLDDLTKRPYLVTDGHKIVQRNKVKALGIEAFFKRIYITHRYGIRYAKPSIYCFDLIRKRERCKWSDMFYVGDNPEKDFVNLNIIGVHTIRVKTGRYAADVAKPGFEAKYVINSLDNLYKVLTVINK